MMRNKLSARKPTTTAQKPPSDYIEKIINYILYTQELLQRNAYQFVFAADETSVLIDSSNSRCVDTVGSKDVS